ncbi:hypothetical protein SDC9_190446 [bioreactor metagenome]|uniref:Uncharacterized protein n=1 Tax=bioreactor metagenome TaxID=1076179 RepID=A0A645HV38_9ZZZZ
MGWSGDEGDLGAGIQCSLSDSVALLARGTVGDNAHRVYGFLRAAGSDHHTFTRKRGFAAEQEAQLGDDIYRFFKAPGAGEPRSQVAFYRANKEGAAFP